VIGGYCGVYVTCILTFVSSAFILSHENQMNPVHCVHLLITTCELSPAEPVIYLPQAVHSVWLNKLPTSQMRFHSS